MKMEEPLQLERRGVEVVVVRGGIEAPRYDGASKGVHVSRRCQQLSCDTPSCEWGAAKMRRDAAGGVPGRRTRAAHPLRSRI